MSYQALANQFKINNPSPIVRRQLILEVKSLMGLNQKREEDLQV